MINFLRVFFFIILSFAAATQGAAQIPGTSSGSASESAAPVLPEDLTPEMVDGLVARMSDDQVRALLLERLDAVAAARADAAP
ncbi:hypothetical protein AB9K41_03815, partial [Cribrihabitans sp. XS_ASV171]